MPGPGEVVDLGDIVLGPWVTFVGRILDEETRGIPGARVRVTEIPVIAFSVGIQDYRSGDRILVREAGLEEVVDVPAFVDRLERKLPIPTTLTDGEGYFRIEGVPIGLTTVVADKEGFLTTYQGPIPTGKSGEKDIGSLVLPRGVTLRGQVIDLAQRPVAGAEVMAGNRLSVADVAILHPGGVTDENGSFSVEALRPGPAYVIARRGVGQGWSVSAPVSAESGEVTLVLPANFDLVVRVLGEGGQPLPEAKLRISKTGALGADRPGFIDTPLELGGRMVVLDPGVWRIEELAPTNYRVRAAAPGHTVAETMASIGTTDAAVDIILEAEIEARVHVVDDLTSEPVEHAKVLVWPEEKSFFDLETAWGRTDVEGTAILHGLSTGAYKVSVEHPAYAMVAAALSLPGEPATVRLIAGGVVEGRIHRGDEPPIEPMLVGVMPRGGGRPGETAFLPRLRATDPLGGFRISNVDPGKYKLVVFDRLLNRGRSA